MAPQCLIFPEISHARLQSWKRSKIQYVFPLQIFELGAL